MSSVYKAAGVDIDAGAQFAQMIKERVGQAWPDVSSQIGGFTGTVVLNSPVDRIKAGADGSGTVAILCALLERFDVLGKNAAAMSLVDAYVGGAHPVALLDVIDIGRLVPERHISIIDGLIDACQHTRKQCFLLGGETAELPDMFRYPWIVNVNTTAIAVPDDSIATGNVRPGQTVFGWLSGGPASNGFSLIRPACLVSCSRRRRGVNLNGTISRSVEHLPMRCWCRHPYGSGKLRFSVSGWSSSQPTRISPAAAWSITSRAYFPMTARQ